MKKILLGIWVFLLFAAPVEAYGSVLHYFTETEDGRRQAAEAAQREFRTLAGKIVFRSLLRKYLSQ